MSKLSLIPFLFLAAGVLSLGAQSLPSIELEDQFGTKSSLEETAGDRTLVVVYRARKAADDAGEHHRIIRSYLDESTSVVRIADLSRVPKLFQELAVRMIKRDAEDIPYYVDLEGSDVEAFGVRENEVGLFFYSNGRLSASRRKSFTDTENLRDDVKSFVEEISDD